MRSSSFMKFAGFVTSTALATSLPVVAEEVSSDPNFEEIIVTAQKREQSIQDVPLTISAFSGTTLEALGVDQFDSLSNLTPGLVVQQQSINNNGYVIRGITSDDGSSEGAARVSVYLNGTDVSRSRASYFEVYDMERVEVVKGPQSTLFGTAASIGAISFITAKPEQDFSAKIQGGIGNYGMRKVDGFITGGNDVVQGRLAFLYKKRDGYIVNNSGEADLNGYERFAIRPSVRFTPNENLTVDIVYNYEKADDTGTAFVNESLLYTDQASLSVPDVSNLGAPDVGVDRETNDVNLTANWDLNDTLGLTYIGAYRDYASLEPFDADGTQYEFLNFAEDAYGDQMSHELRLNYSGDKLNGFIGASYFEEDATQHVPFTTEEGLFLSCVGAFASAGITGCTPSATQLVTGGALTAVPYQGHFTNKAKNNQFSLFGDLSYAVTDRLELTAGLRYTHEERESTYFSNMQNSMLLAGVGVQTNLFFGAIVNTNDDRFTGESSDDTFLPRLNLLYTVSDSLNLYATVAKGRRSEVLDLSSTVAEIVPAEKVTNYEAGIKGSSADGAMQYALSVFLQDYQNFQVSIIDPVSGQSRTENAGSASNLGVEADIRWAATPDFMLIANAAFIDAGINDKEDNGEYAGNRFRLQPKWTGAVSYIYRRAVTESIDVTSSATWSYRSSTYFDIVNNYREDSVNLLNMRLGLAASDDNWAITAFANNLLDKDYIMDAGNTGGGFGYATYIEGAPRTYGIELTKRF